MAKRASACVFVALCTVASPALGVELFGPHVGLRTGDGPSHAVSADFDDNGALDFAVANFWDGTVTVALGDGLGGFEVAPATPVPPYVFPTSIAAGDFDLDGAVDLVVAHPFANLLTVLIGDGDGGFVPQAFVPVGSIPLFVAAADFDFDGAADLAVASSLDDSVIVLLGDRAGGFTEMPEIFLGPGTQPHFIAVADLNGDSDPDLAVANALGESVTVLLGDGRGGFAAAAELPAGEGRAPSAVAAEDLDLDGDVDLAVANGNADSVTVWLGDGTGQFGMPREIPDVGDGPVWVSPGDLDADGAPDLLVANLYGDSLTVLRGDGQGGFVKTLELDQRVRSIAVGDFTVDGALDAAVVASGSDLLTVIPGDGLGGFTSVARIPVQISGAQIPAVGCLDAGDFDGDGHADLAVASSVRNIVLVYRGDGNGGFDEAGASRIQLSAPQCLTADDLDGDGDLDLAVTQSDTASAVQVLLGDGLGGFAAGQQIPLGARGDDPRVIDSADLNLDGNPDLVTFLRAGAVVVLLGDEGVKGTFREEAMSVIRIGREAAGLAIDELNGDGVPDLAVADIDGDAVIVLLGDANGPFPNAVSLPVLRVDAPEEIAGDYEVESAPFGPALTAEGLSGVVELGDDGVGLTTDGCEPFLNEFEGRIALVDRVLCAYVPGTWASDATIQVRAAEDAGASAVIFVGERPGEPPTLRGSGATSIPAVGISRDAGEAIRSALPDVEVTLIHPETNHPRLRRLPTGRRPERVAVGDFNGDGARDVVASNSSGGSLSILFGDGTGEFVQADEIPVGPFPVPIAVADFNLDGLDDLAFGLWSENTVAVLIGDGAGGFARTPDFQTGDAGPRRFVAADLNEDGPPDLAVAGESSIGILFNRLAERVDPNGSNRVDGFDVAEIGRLWGKTPADPAYRRTHDVDLNGIIDGDDLKVVAREFGQLVRRASPLRPHLEDSLPPSPDTITLHEVASEGDLLTVELRVNDTDDRSSAAAFAVTFPADPMDADRSPVLEVVGFDPGDFFSGGVSQTYDVTTEAPDRAEIRIARLPLADVVGAGQRLLNVKLRARRPGTAVLDFAPIAGRSDPTLLDSSGREVAGVSFVGGVNVRVDVTDETAVGQRIGFSPPLLDFRDVPLDVPSKKRLRLSNFGFSDLEIRGVTPTLPELVPFLTSRVTIPPFGSVELPVRFSATTAGVYAGELIVSSDDPDRPELRVPVLARSAAAIRAAPGHVEFGGVAVGREATRKVSITNRGDAPLELSGVQVSAAEFTVEPGFSSLQPGESGTLRATFEPTGVGERHALLTLGFATPGQAVAVLSLAGTGLGGP